MNIIHTDFRNHQYFYDQCKNTLICTNDRFHELRMQHRTEYVPTYTVAITLVTLLSQLFIIEL